MTGKMTGLVLAAVLVAGASALFPPAAIAVEDEPSIEVKLDRGRIYEGESVLYEVLLRNVEDPAQPDMSAFTGFDVEFLGAQNRDFSSVTIVNGRLTDNSFHGTSFRYSLTPKGSGTMTVPAPVATVGGEQLTGQILRLEVIAPEEQDLVFLSVTADRERVYLLQPFTVTLSIQVKALPEPYTDQSPVSLREFPALSIPWVDEIQGLKTESATAWLTTLINRREGFSINGFRDQRDILFSAFQDRAPLHRFRPKVERVRRPDLSGRETEYYEYTLTRRFEPVEVGEYDFGPITLKGPIPSEVDSLRRALTEEVFANAPAVRVTVTDAPLAGRPESFTGAVGNFRLTADLQPRKARVGDPVTLTLNLKGLGTIDRAFAPDLEAIPEVAENFRIYEATAETKGRSRLFTYSLRPLDAAITAFPSVPLSYFDVDKDRYVTLRTGTIPLEVEEAETLADGDIVSGGGRSPDRRMIEKEQGGIFADVIDLTRLRDQRVRPERWAVLIGGLLVLYLGAAIATRALRKRYGDRAAQRRRSAPGRARARLKEARALLRQGGSDDRGAAGGGAAAGIDALRGALTGFAGDVAGVPSEGMTHRDLRDRLVDAGVSDAVAGRLAGIHESCDALRYGVTAGEGDMAAEALGAFEEAVKELRKGGKLR